LGEAQNAVKGMDRFQNMLVALHEPHSRWIGHPAILRESCIVWGHKSIIDRFKPDVSPGISLGLAKTVQALTVVRHCQSAK
jgi:hypothetical protein